MGERYNGRYRGSYRGKISGVKAPNRTTFEPGHKKRGGRKKGSENKLSASVKECILTAIERYGQDGKGKEGMIGYFFSLCSDKVLMTRLVEKILPMQVTGKDGGAIQVFTLPPETAKHLKPEELAALEKALQVVGGQVRKVEQEGDADNYAASIGESVH